MDKFAKSILNYYAAFTETRFNFGKKIDYIWTDDATSLNFSVFPEFQKIILNNIKNGQKINFNIKKDEYTVKADAEKYKRDFIDIIDKEFNEDYLKKITNKAKEENPEIRDTEIQRLTYRTYNLEIREKNGDLLTAAINEKLEELRNIYGFRSMPISTFNQKSVEQIVYDEINKITQKNYETKRFIDEVKSIILNANIDITAFDLFASILKVQQVIGLGTLYLFFNEIGNGEKKEKYPLFLIEVIIENGENYLKLISERDVVIINVQAINLFKYDKILTTPRASRFENAAYYLGNVNKFLQVTYNNFDSSILEPQFIPFAEEEKPTIKYKSGLQVIAKENRKLLDYSELITHIDAGGGKKFKDFVKNYISENVANTNDEVEKAYKENNPRKTVNYLLSTIPISLNTPQKKILTALDNKENKIIVVDGPPGTGKSYTIAAITYWANQKQKSIVITSHKKAALDVIERMLTDKFLELHPRSKPSILRLDENGNTRNNIENTLSSSVLAAASNRASEINEKAINKDLERTKENLEKEHNDVFKTAEIYEEFTKNIIKYEELRKELEAKGIGTENREIHTDIIINWENVNDFCKILDEADIEKISTENLKTLLTKKEDIKEISRILEGAQEITKITQESEKLKTIEAQTLDEYNNITDEINNYLIPESPIFTEDKNFRYKFNKKIKLISGKARQQFLRLIKEINSDKFAAIIENVCLLNRKEKERLSITDLYNSKDDLKEIAIYFEKVNKVEPLKSELGLDEVDYKELIKIWREYEKIADALNTEILEDIEKAKEYYKEILEQADIKFENIKTLRNLFKGKGNTLREYIEVTKYLEKNRPEKKFNPQKIKDYYECLHKLTESVNDKRIKELNKYGGDVQKILLSIRKGKRIQNEQLDILLKYVSCIISEPDMISKYFPMTEDAIDILVIDEASQVSIAESISLILRAKQVVIFGDELQYGAVSAVNVNTEYSNEYFKEIIGEYSASKRINVDRKTVERISREASEETSEDDAYVSPIYTPQDGTIEWLKTFSIRTSTLNFARAIKNYSTSLNVHFRSFPEIIDYSNEYFYKPNSMELTVNRIRTKPLKEVLRFLKVETKGNAGNNINIDEIEAIKEDIEKLIKNGFKGTIGIISSFREQTTKIEEILNREMQDFHILKRDNKLSIWFVGDVQGEERDIVYYSFVEDNKNGNANLGTIYPVIGQTADNIRSLKMQRLNVGFSRAKDTMVFVHSMPIEEYHRTKLGDALKYYKNTLEKSVDNYIEDEKIFGSPAEKELYKNILETEYYKENRDKIKIIAQFPIGEYIKASYSKNIPKYRVDFLLTYSDSGKEKTLILEYDGVEYHTNNPEIVNQYNFSQEYLEYDIERQLELESYGYKFLRINKFTLRPNKNGETKAEKLSKLLEESFKQ